MSHFDCRRASGSLLLIGLMVIAAIFLLWMFLRRRQPAAAMQYAAAGADDNGPRRYESPPAPAWSGADKAEPVFAAESAAPALGVTRKPLPEGFDAEGFAKEAKRQYVDIQRSYDKADRKALSKVMTAEMSAEIGRGLTSAVRISRPRSSPRRGGAGRDDRGRQSLGERALHRPVARGRRATAEGGRRNLEPDQACQRLVGLAVGRHFAAGVTPRSSAWLRSTRVLYAPC